MKRKEEIIQLLKSLLAQADSAIDDNHYTDDAGAILSSAKKLSNVSKKIDGYLGELKSLPLND